MINHSYVIMIHYWSMTLKESENAEESNGQEYEWTFSKRGNRL